MPETKKLRRLNQLTEAEHLALLRDYVRTDMSLPELEAKHQVDCDNIAKLARRYDRPVRRRGRRPG